MGRKHRIDLENNDDNDGDDGSKKNNKAARTTTHLTDTDTDTADADAERNRWTGALYSARYYSILDTRSKLPVYQFKDKLLQAVRDHQIVVVEGETGSGTCYFNLTTTRCIVQCSAVQCSVVQCSQQSTLQVVPANR